MPTVKLSNNKCFFVKPGERLLDGAKFQGIVLEHSCRTGRCGVCRAQVVSGITSVEIPETGLSNEEVEAGFILTCCRSSVDDLVLNVADVGPLANIETRTIPCRIDSLVRLSYDVVSVTLRFPPDIRLDYLAGQHIEVIGGNGVRRCYSIANAPRADGKIDLHIRNVDDGVMSRYWFERAKINDLLRMEGPMGTFSLRDTSCKNLVFLATGTGIAPIKAMLEELEPAEIHRDERKVFVYWGARKLDDIYLRHVSENSVCEFNIALSRPKPGWKGRVGYVQAAFLADELSLSETTVYACGSPEMVSSARRELIKAGLTPENFYSDAFVSTDNGEKE